MRIANFRRTDTVSLPGLYLSSVGVSTDDGPGVNETEVANSINGDKDSLDGILFRGVETDVLEVDGIHRLIRVLRPPHTRCVIETNGSRPTVLDDLVGAGYADIVSFVFDRYPKKCQLDSMRIARDGDCRFAVTVVTEPQRLTVEDVLDLGDRIKGAMLLQIKRSSEPGALQYKKSEISSLAKSMKGTAKEVRIV